MASRHEVLHGLSCITLVGLALGAPAFGSEPTEPAERCAGIERAPLLPEERPTDAGSPSAAKEHVDRLCVLLESTYIEESAKRELVWGAWALLQSEVGVVRAGQLMAPFALHYGVNEPKARPNAPSEVRVGSERCQDVLDMIAVDVPQEVICATLRERALEAADVTCLQHAEVPDSTLACGR